MSETSTAPRAPVRAGPGARLRPSLAPGGLGRFVLLVLAVYGALRLFTTGVLLWIADSQQDPSVYDGEVPRYFEVATLWDGAWYERIATEGYPDPLPRDEAGELRQNAWAFYPIFPMTARLVSTLTGAHFAVSATVVATLLGVGAAVLVGVLLRSRLGTGPALAGVALLAAFPASPTMQVAYTESLALLLLTAFLLLVDRERWWWAAGAALVTGLARPVALPLGLVALVCVVLRWRRRGERPITRREGVGMLGSLVACGLSGLIWPAIVAWRTGSATAYTDTMSTWRGGEQVTPFVPLLRNTEYLWGEDNVRWLALGTLLLLVSVLGPWARGLGPAVRTWLLGYPLYLAAALDPWTSIYRYLLLLFPLLLIWVGGAWAPGDVRRPPRWLVVTGTLVLLALSLGWQVWWLWELFRFEPPTDNPP